MGDDGRRMNGRWILGGELYRHRPGVTQRLPRARINERVNYVILVFIIHIHPAVSIIIERSWFIGYQGNDTVVLYCLLELIAKGKLLPVLFLLKNLPNLVYIMS